MIRYFGFLPCIERFGPVTRSVAHTATPDYRHYERLRAAASLLVEECADLGLLTAERTIAKLLAELERSAAHALADATRLVA